MKKEKYSKKDRRFNKYPPHQLDKTSFYQKRYNGIKISNLTEKELIDFRISKASKSNYGVLKLIDFNLSEIPEEIFEIKNLRVLDLSDNNISEIPNRIIELSKLKILILKNNKLRSLPNSLEKLNKLEKLIVGGNKFNVDFFFPKNLKELHLSKTKINNLPESIFTLNKLEILWLSNNNISKIPSQIKRLNSLKKIYLSHNYLDELPEEIYHLSDLKGIFLDGNPMKNIPIYSWKGNKLKDWKNYYSEILKGNTKNFKAKIIFLGKGEVGKSTLMRRLEEPTVTKSQLKEEIKQTNGINIRPLIGIEIPNESSKFMPHKFEINMWDFGGQEIQQNVHQFFLTENALFLLLWAVRNADNRYNYFRDWLNTIETYSGEKSRVILVQNKAYGEDSNLEYIDHSSLQKAFPQLGKFVEIGALDGINLNNEAGLLNLIKSELLKLPKVGETIPLSWELIKEKLSDKKSKGENIIKRIEFEQICKEFNLLNPDSIAQIITWLHEIGTIIYYPTKIDTIILNPEWITTSVYKILLDNEGFIKKNEGKFNNEYLYKILGSDYDETIIHLMIKFDLCFKLNEDDGKSKLEFIVPSLLPFEKPKLSEFQFNKEFFLYEYNYSILPKGVMGRFISMAYKENLVLSDNYWQDGVFLKLEDGTQALIELVLAADTRTDSIQIKIEGKSKNQLFESIKKIFEKINKKTKLVIEHTFCTNGTECTNKPNSRFDISTLKRMSENNVDEVQCQQCFKMISVDGLIKGDYFQFRILDTDQVRKLLEKDKMNDAIDLIKMNLNLNNDKEIRDTLIHIESNYTRFTYNEAQNLASETDLAIKRDQIRNSILKLLDLIDASIPKK